MTFTYTYCSIGLLVILVGLFIKAPDYAAVMEPASPGIHGLYSLADFDPGWLLFFIDFKNY